MDRDHRKDSSLSKGRKNGYGVAGTSVPHRPMVPVSRKRYPEQFKRSRVNSRPEVQHQAAEKTLQPVNGRTKGRSKIPDFRSPRDWGDPQ